MMPPGTLKNFQYAQEVIRAQELRMPIVALESTVITHGLPYPENLSLAEDMENEVRANGATPATIGVIEGNVQVGMHASQLYELATKRTSLAKISIRDIAPTIVRMGSGGTTVAATVYVAHKAGIRVFATGGIGGVHHELNPKRKGAFDISADLPALARIPMVVVCAGAKAILDLAATLEMLETWSVPVVGFQSDDFPAFYSRSSGYKTSTRVDSAEEAAHLARTHWSLGMESAVLVTVPPPEDMALPADQVKDAVIKALRQAQDENIRGQQVTPYLLEKISDLTGGASLRSNISLLLNNARIASQIARHLNSMERATNP